MKRFQTKLAIKISVLSFAKFAIFYDLKCLNIFILSGFCVINGTQ